jgi:uncharacterized protein YhdP
MRKRLVVLLAIGAAVLVLAVAGVAVSLHFSLDGIVQRAIEEHGSRVTGTSVRVASVDLSPRTGRGVVRGVRVTNPDGWSGADAIEIAEIRFEVDVASLARRRPVVVERVDIEAPHVLYEVDRGGKANLDAIKAAADRSRKASGPPASGEAPDLLLRIAAVAITGGRVTADLRAVGAAEERLALEPIRLSNVGGTAGETGDVVAAKIMAAIEKEVSRAVAREGVKRAVDRALGGGTSDVKERVRGLFGRRKKE